MQQYDYELAKREVADRVCRVWRGPADENEFWREQSGLDHESYLRMRMLTLRRAEAR